ncbi:S-methyl thiohydantoin desulfurase domain-containing protein [Nonomuraea wenchangensis]|uniref:S-methyl thiohydantoin desulfurase domain-containing protein n=1 Tax=Nonomuraea wenchangensis TaxID=568860 RepID=UPI00378AFDF7
MSERLITAADVPALLAGAEFFSTSAAGEGIDFAGVWLGDILDHTGPVRLVAAGDLDPGTACAAIGAMGSTTAMAELPPSGDEPAVLARSLEGRCGPLGAVLPLNAASVNALFPVAAAALLGLPLIDCDGMGRVFPLIHQTTFELAGLSLAPMAAVSAGYDSLLLETGSARAERLARVVAQSAGGWLLCALYPTRVGELAGAAIPGSMSRVLEVGRVLLAHAPGRPAWTGGPAQPPWESGPSPDGGPSWEGGPFREGGPGARRVVAPHERLLAELTAVTGASVLGGGRLVEIGPSVRQAAALFPGNPVGLAVHDHDSGRLIRIEAHNELILALSDGSLAAAVPDLLCLLDRGTLRMTGPGRLTAGDLVDVLVVPAAPLWHTIPGLALGGPGAFGFPLRHPKEASR